MILRNHIKQSFFQLQNNVMEIYKFFQKNVIKCKVFKSLNQIHQQLLFLKPNILQFQDHHEYKQNEEESYKQLNRKKKLQKKIKQLEI